MLLKPVDVRGGKMLVRLVTWSIRRKVASTILDRETLQPFAK